METISAIKARLERLGVPQNVIKKHLRQLRSSRNQNPFCRSEQPEPETKMVHRVQSRKPGPSVKG